MVGEGAIGVPAAVSGGVLEGAGAVGPSCPTALLKEAGVESGAGDRSAGAGEVEAGLVPAACAGGGRVLNAVKGGEA